MGYFFICIVSTVAGLAGWWIGQFFGFAFASALSLVLSIVGLHYGARWNRDYFGG